MLHGVMALACDPCAYTGAACSKGCFVFCVSMFCGENACVAVNCTPPLASANENEFEV